MMGSMDMPLRVVSSHSSFCGEGDLEGSTPAGNRDVVHGRVAEVLEHRCGDIVLCKGCGQG